MQVIFITEVTYMSQLLKVHCLTEEQVTVTLNNLCKIRGLDEPKLISKSKPKYSQEMCKKYNIPFITKFAEKYHSYLATRNGKDNPETNEGFIVIFADKVDVYFLTACAALYIEHFYDKVKKDAHAPHFTILPAFTVSESLKSHYKRDILPDCNYRIFSLAELYPMIGSTTHQYKLTYNYEKHPYEPAFNGQEYVKIYDNDPIVKMLNAMPGDIITCNALAFDDSISSQTFIRQVEPSIPNIHRIHPSGVCVRYGQNVPIDEQK